RSRPPTRSSTIWRRSRAGSSATGRGGARAVTREIRSGTGSGAASGERGGSRGMIAAMPRVLVVDRSPQTRDTVAELLGELDEVAWASRDGAAAQLRAAVAAGQPYDVVLLEADPAPTPHLIRELATQGGGVRVVLAAAPPAGASLAARCGA